MSVTNVPRGVQLPSWQRSPETMARVREVLAKIEDGAAEVVLWAPGTSEKGVPKPFQDAVKERFGAPAVALSYPATWQLASSVAEGEQVLRGVLDALSKRMNPPRVFLAGQSQGAWVISNVLADERLAQQVERSVLLGHPGLAPHQKFEAAKEVLEINHRADPVPMPLRGGRAQILDTFENLRAKNPFVTAGKFALYGALNPDYLVTWAWSQRHRVGIGDAKSDPHCYEEDMPRAADFLAGSKVRK